MKLFALSLSLSSRDEKSLSTDEIKLSPFTLNCLYFFLLLIQFHPRTFFFNGMAEWIFLNILFETLKVCSHQKPLYLKKIHWNLEQKKKKNPSYIKILFHQEIKQCWNGFVSHSAIFIIDSISKEWNVKSIFFNKNRRKGNKNS